MNPGSPTAPIEGGDTARDLKGARGSNRFRFSQIPLRFSFLLRCFALLLSLAL